MSLSSSLFPASCLVGDPVEPLPLVMLNYLPKIIAGFIVVSSGLSSCNSGLRINQPILSKNMPPATVSPALKSSEFRNLEESVYQQINQYRQSKSLPPLSLNETISQQARLHSEAMAKDQVPFSHNGFENRISAIAKSIPYRRAAENVAYNQGYSDPTTQSVQGWLNSTGHRQNIEGEFDLTGIGVSKNTKGEYYFTQIFIKRR